MARRLATLLELQAELDSLRAAGSQGSWNHSEPIRSIPAAFSPGKLIAPASAPLLLRCSASTGTSPSNTSTVSSPSSAPSPCSSSGSVAAAARSFEVHRTDEVCETARHMVRDGYMQGLIREFVAESTAGCRDALLERWFSELDVGWVLHANQWSLQRLEWMSLLDLVEAWTRALSLMVRVLSVAQIDLAALNRIPAAAGAGGSDDSLFARFAEESILKMLEFVDAVAAIHSDRAPDERLPGMLQVFACVTDASDDLLASFRGASESYRRTHGVIKNTFEKMSCVYLRKRAELSEAVWSIMEEARASILEGDYAWESPQIEAGIHKATRLTMNHVKLLWRNDDALTVILQDHHFGMFVSESEGFSSVVNLVLEMVSCLEQRLEETSRSFPDPGLRYLFLLNNSHFITGQVESLCLPALPYWIPLRERRTDSYMESDLHVSWTPVLSCLYDAGAAPLRLRRYYTLLFEKKGYSALDRFQSEFHRVYRAQKMWKVPSPELRERLRGAIVEKVVSGYGKYLEERPVQEKNISHPTHTPLELEDMIKELFEG